MKQLLIGIGVMGGFMGAVGGYISLMAGAWGPRWLSSIAVGLFFLAAIGVFLKCAWLIGEAYEDFTKSNAADDE